MARASIPADRLAELDLLRFLAASMVVAYHWTDYSILPPAGDALTHGLTAVAAYGYLGVDLFFLISGFVIAWSATRQSPITFLCGRLGRLYPSFWISNIFLVVLSVFLAGTEARFSLAASLANATLWPKAFGFPFLDDVYWTLVVELKFYLLASVAILLAPRFNLETLCRLWLLLAVACFFTVHLAAQSGLDSFLRIAALYPFGPLFIAGTTLFYIWRDTPTRSRLCTLALCLPIAMTATAERAPIFIHDATLGSQLAAAFGTLMCFCAMTALALGWWQVPWKRTMLILGSYSYPIYLVHNKIARSIWDATSGPQGLRFGIVVVSTTALVTLITFASERKATPAFKRALTALFRRALTVIARGRRQPPAGSAGSV